MPLEVRARPRADSSQRPWSGSRALRVLRVVWPYVLAAAALLGASEILWLWHSWPVRQVLESEQAVVGAPSI